MLVAFALARPVTPPRVAGPQRTVIDGRGDVITLAAPLRRVALLWGAGFGEDLLVARDPAHLEATADPWDEAMKRDPVMLRAFPDLPGVPTDLSIRAPYGASIETLLLRRPTAIVTIPWAAALFQPLGLPAVVVPMQGTEEALFRQTRLLAAVAGQSERGDALVASYNAALSALHDELYAAGPVARLSVLLLGVEGPGRFWSASIPEWETLIERAGAQSLLPGPGLRHLDTERVIALDPDVVVLRPSWSERDRQPARFMAADWARGLRAARDRRVYAWPPGVTQLTNNIVEYPLVARWFAELLHPDRLAPRLRSLMATTYERELRVAPTAAEIDRALDLRGNADSACYGRFGADPS